ncbi:DEAD/DEAH box helicase [soil metagenome]
MQALLKKIPTFQELSAGEPADIILDRFLDYVSSVGHSLYPAQEEAILALVAGENVILNTPTGSGKSLVAEAMIFASMALGRRSVYTCPVKALVNEKFLALCKLFGAESVGLMTGDGSVNREAPILCCTAEILANMAITEGAQAKVDDVVMDEFHYYSDRERGMAWQVPLLELSNARFLLMSATLGGMDFFKESLEKLTEKPTRIVTGTERPVPLEFEYRGETALHETIQDLMKLNRAPIYLVNFTQNLAADEAQNLMSIDFLSKEQKKALLERIKDVPFRSPYGKELARYIKHGIGVHHAGLLPKYRILVERLAQEGFLKVISGTDTLGVGVNIPIRTVLFSKLCKYDGTKTGILSSRDFHQISGRAGRRGFDDKGYVVAQAPEHVIENVKLERKALANPGKAKKIVKAKPPEKGFVHWDEATFQKSIKSTPEALQSRFKVDHGLVLSVLARKHETTGENEGCESLRRLIRVSHESEANKKKHRARAFELFRSLVDRKIVGLNPLAVHADLQADFSLHQSLSLWLLDTIQKLDPASETYALDVVTLCEAIAESPDLILRKQTDRARNNLFHQLKADGVEFEERQEKLDAVEAPKPLRDFIYETFNAFSDKHPWVGTENIRPKSIIREMLENGYGFADYIREYDLQRGEGVLLRTVNEVYKILAQTVPDAAKDEALREIEIELALILRSVDSSLLDEWDRLRTDFVDLGGKVAVAGGKATGAGEQAAIEATAEGRKIQFRRVWRAEIVRLLRALGSGDVEECENIVREWSEKGVRDLSISTELEAAQVAASDSGAILEWTSSKIESSLRLLKAAGFSGVRTDLKAKNASFSKFDFGAPNADGKLVCKIEQTMFDLPADSENEAYLRLSIF